MRWLVRLLKGLLVLGGIFLLGLIGLYGAARMFGWSSQPGNDPDAFWELAQETGGALALTAAAPEATVTLRVESSYQIDNFRFQRPDLTVVEFESSSTNRDPLCVAASSRGYSTGSFHCPPIGHTDCIASSDYPPRPGQRKTQDGTFLSYLCIPNGTARPDLMVQASLVETEWMSEPRRFDYGLSQYVNDLYGYSQAGSATQPVGSYVSTFRIKLAQGEPAKGDRVVQWKAIANIRGMWGTPTAVPSDARLKITQLK